MAATVVTKRTIHVVALLPLALTFGGCKETDLQGCIEEVAAGPRRIATVRDQRFEGKVSESAARCRGGDTALKFLNAPWVDWGNYYGTRDETGPKAQSRHECRSSCPSPPKAR